MSQQLLIALASIVTLGIAAEWIAWRVHLPSILVLLVFGFVAGPATGFLDPDAMLGELLFPIVSISVAVILFEGGMSLRLRELRQIGRVVRNLVSVGALLSWVLGAAAARYVLGLDLAPAVLLGAILVVTGPTVIVPLLRHVRPVPHVASTLKWEGILIDPIGAVLAVLVFEAVLAGEVEAATAAALRGLLTTVAIGGALAAFCSGLLVLLIDRQWVPDFLQSPLVLTVVVAAFALSNTLQPESGLLTATLMGVAIANQKVVDVKHILEFKENLRVLLISGLFILLAARLHLHDLRQIGVPELAFLAVLIFIVRPAVVGISALGSEFSWRERALISWVAPRGIVAAAVSAIFAIELAEAGYGGADRLVVITFMVIIGTVTIYGLSATPVARWLDVAQPDPQGVLIVGAHPWARAIARELKDEGLPVRLVDTNYTNIAEARMEGLAVYYGSALTEGTLDNIDLAGIGRLLAFTSNDEVNSLTALHFSEVFGRDSVYQLPPEQLETTSKQVMSRRLRGRFLFAPHATYWHLTARFDAGADVKTTNLTGTFDFQTFNELYRGAIPLFLIGENGRLTIFTVKNPPEPSPGHRVVAVVDPLDEAGASAASN
ncbi:MAG: sodium:proton antiporter [Gemmatimonadota bacterium]|nr:MAG: sodium:proton antiporter [Gemmatimonadota bacterium]